MKVLGHIKELLFSQGERNGRRTVVPAPSVGVSCVGSDEIEGALLDYLTEANPVVALLITGKWGSGKTFYINTRKERLATRSGKKILMLSVAGLSTKEELDQALFMAAAPWLFSGYTQAIGVFFKAGLRFAKIEPRDFKFSPDFREGKIAVVIDDVDRFFGDIRVVAGLVIDLVDQSRLHTIVIASEDNMKHFSEFGSWKEKIIGSTLKVAPDLDEMMTIFISEVADNFARDRLERNREALMSIVLEWGMGNLRSLRHGVKDMARLLAALGPRLDELGGFEKVLVGGVFIGLLEVKRDSRCSDVVAKVFSHKGLTAAAQARLIGAGSKEEESDDSLFVSTLIKRYASYEFSLFPGGDVFERFFEYGAVDAYGILHAFSALTTVTSRRQVFLSNYLDLPQHEFENEAASVIRELQLSAVTSLSELANIYVTLRYISARGALSMSENDVRDLVVNSIARIPASAVSDPDEGNDLWFVEKGDDLDRSIQTAISRKREDARAANTEKERLSVFDSGAEESLSDRLQRWKLRPLFIGNAADLVGTIFKLSPAEIQDVMRLFGSRRSLPSFEKRLHDELGTLNEMVAIIRLRLPRMGILSIKDSQLNQLADVIASFAHELDAYHD